MEATPARDATDGGGETMRPLIDDNRNFDDLPPIDTTRWVARRKAQILTAIGSGRLARAEACARYNISEAELRLWERAVECAGVPGLRVTRVQIYRPVFEARGSR
jgi:hypothetical protein